MSLEARRTQINSLIQSAGATFFAVEFFKKDGSLRTMQIQLPAAKNHIVGDAASDSSKQAVATRKANNENLINVWDVASQGFRSVNLDSLIAVTVRGTRFDVSLPISV